MKRMIFPAAMILFLAACGGAIDSLDEAGADVSATSWQLFTVQRDERKCMAPMCGGFWATAQGAAAPSYVSGIDFSKSALDAATQEMVLGAPAEELLLHAKLSAKDARGLRTLVVKDAYRGMPGIVPAAKDAMYSMQQSSSVASDQLSGKTAKVTSVDVSGAAKAFVDQTWLANRVQQHGAIASAHVTKSVLAASQVFLHLPETEGPCAKPVEKACGSDEVQAYARTADRCLQPLGCVARAICPMMQPSCPAEYVAVSWTAANGCLATACDPAWVR